MKKCKMTTANMKKLSTTVSEKVMKRVLRRIVDPPMGTKKLDELLNEIRNDGLIRTTEALKD